MATATKLDPEKWARAKAKAIAKMGGKHSARAMQLAVSIIRIWVVDIKVLKALLISYLNGLSKIGDMLIKVMKRNQNLKEVDTCQRK